MKIAGTTALVTGANRGIGRAIVEALLERGAGKVYATARDAETLAPVVELDPDRVVALELDITDEDSIARAASEATDAQLVVNNAGTLTALSFLETPVEKIRQDMEVNYFATLNMIRAFTPMLEANEGAFANLLSIVSLASMPMIGGYCASKAAAHSMTQAVRAELAAKGVAVHGVFPGPVDTDMAKDFEMDKTSPAQVAAAIVDGIEAGESDIFPDPMSQQMHGLWRESPRALEGQFAGV